MPLPSLPNFRVNNLNLFLYGTKSLYRVQWLRGRASDSRLREPGFESYAAVLKTLGKFFHSTLLQYK